jgi:hypothetical protein
MSNRGTERGLAGQHAVTLGHIARNQAPESAIERQERIASRQKPVRWTAG